ncbi:hypothetical protein EDC04DRAFT_2904831 [Pisolithus marmoratus]|nr:hypothetical protein EDC04DRAFT_2904831 [Pisolithus marmoratus]
MSHSIVQPESGALEEKWAKQNKELNALTGTIKTFGYDSTETSAQLPLSVFSSFAPEALIGWQSVGSCFLLRPGVFKLEQLGDMEFLACFGWPLFWTLIKASTGVDEDKSELIKSTMELACAKLINSSAINMVNLSDVAMLAILDILITINYEPRWDLAHQYETSMVASYMRIAFSIPQHQACIHSGYPPEPFLAEAVSCQMHCYLQSNHMMAMLLQNNFNNGLIDHGQKGEVVMCLLRMAYMNAIIAEQADKISHTHQPNFSKGCNVLCFLEALFSNKFHEKILQSKPDNHRVSTCTLQDAFRHAVV